MSKYRPASVADLNNYFKIKDLLSGLSDSQQESLRKNIGLGSPSTVKFLNANGETVSEFLLFLKSSDTYYYDSPIGDWESEEPIEEQEVVDASST